MFGIPLNYWGVIICVGVVLVSRFWPAISSGFAKLPALIPSGKPAAVTRLDTIAALDKAYEFCADPEYRKAIRTAIGHLYDQHPEAA